ncbi:MAG: SDR family oxidoreductase, partial [Planctomycetales bacterium]
ALFIAGTMDTPMKRYDLLQAINTRAPFMMAQLCSPHLAKAENPHILNISPPLNLDPKWFGNHLAYTISKYGMSMCVLGMAEEFKGQGIAANALWPKTAVATAAVRNLLGGDEAIRRCRKPEIVSDAAHVILCRDAGTCSGNFFVDEEVLAAEGVADFESYAVAPGTDLFPDVFL